METQSFEPFQRKHVPPPKERRGEDIKTFPSGLSVSVLETLSQSGVCIGLLGGLTALGFVSSLIWVYPHAGRFQSVCRFLHLSTVKRLYCGHSAYIINL